MAGVALVYVGTYTGSGSEGIYLLRLDLESGALERVGVTPGVENPSYLAFAPDGRHLYAVSEVTESGGRPTGAVAAFALDPATGDLHLLGEQSSEGTGPCHLSVDATGACVLVANYVNGVVAQLPIRPDGSLGPATGVVQHQASGAEPSRHGGPHAHWICPDPTNQYALAVDLGLDRIFCYGLDPDGGRLPPHDRPWTRVAAGAGPRHFVFHPNGRYGYLITEMANTFVAYAYEASRGSLTELQTLSTLPPGYAATSYCSEVQITPDGRFLYGANRGHDSIAVFRVDPDSGRLSPVEITPSGGKNPRHFSVDPTGAFLLAAGAESDNVAVFRIDPDSGRLTPTGNQVQIPRPVCVKVLSQ